MRVRIPPARQKRLVPIGIGKLGQGRSHYRRPGEKNRISWGNGRRVGLAVRIRCQPQHHLTKGARVGCLRLKPVEMYCHRGALGPREWSGAAIVLAVLYCGAVRNSPSGSKEEGAPNNGRSIKGTSESPLPGLLWKVAASG